MFTYMSNSSDDVFCVLCNVYDFTLKKLYGKTV